jgi:hypothetical protein
VVDSNEGRVVGAALDDIEDDRERRQAMLRALAAIANPPELSADKRPGLAQRKRQ